MSYIFYDKVNSKCISGKRNEWISVKDRLPEPGNMYLVWDGECDECYLAHIDPDNGRWIGFNFFYMDHITHWMPLPNPPEE